MLLLRLLPIVTIAAVLAAMSARAQTASAAQAGPAPAPAPVAMLETITVSGEQPGPGLWKVSRDGHVLWILGTVSPLPERMAWRSDQVEQAIAGSQRVLGSPSATIEAGSNKFTQLLLLPSLIGMRTDPERRPLSAIVPEQDYARWLLVKARYIGGDRGVERFRPIFAALRLYEKAVKRVGLRSSGEIARAVKRMADRHDVPVMPVNYTVQIDKPRQVIKTFKASTLDDVECFRQVVALVDTGLGGLVRRANAWAVGDLDRLRALGTDPRQACLTAIAEASVAQQLGISDMTSRVRATWLAAAVDALERYPQTFALLPMDDMLSSESLLGELQAKGYQVTAPDAEDAIEELP